MNVTVKKLLDLKPDSALSGEILMDPVKRFLEKVYTASPFVGPLDEILEKLNGLNDNALHIPHGIYSDDQPVGFFILAFNKKTMDYFQNSRTSCWLESFMIADSQQGKGYALESLKILPKIIRNEYPMIQHLNLTVNLRNKIAISLYLKAGFMDTDELYLGGPVGPQHIFTMNL